jgi:anti-anti-sigma factor
MYSAIGQDAGQLVCRDVVISGTASSVQLGGELDRSTASRLEQLLDRLRCDGHRQVFLDLSGLEFLSAAGLTVFLRSAGQPHIQEFRSICTRMVVGCCHK